MFCKDCGAPVVGRFCSKCGAPSYSSATLSLTLEQPTKKASRTIGTVVLGGLAVGFILAALNNPTTNNPAKHTVTSAIHHKIGEQVGVGYWYYLLRECIMAEIGWVGIQ